jgi:hypothetical protein
MFERGDHMVAVTAEKTMIAVVHHHNIALRSILARNGRKPFNEALRRLRLPIPANF